MKNKGYAFFFGGGGGGADKVHYDNGRCASQLLGAYATPLATMAIEEVD